MESSSMKFDIRSLEGEHENLSKLLDAVPELEPHYKLLRVVGSGTFSKVYLAKPKTKGTYAPKHVALKHIIPTSHPSRVLMELRCLHLLGGLRNVVGVWACHRHLSHIVLAMPYFIHDSTSDYMGCLSPCEVRDYLANLLWALQHVHSHGILHRDVKPANFLYHRASRRYCLVDFGLAQYVGTTASSVGPPALPLPPTPHLMPARPVKRKLPVLEAIGDQEHATSTCKRLKSCTTAPLRPHAPLLVPVEGKKVLIAASPARLNCLALAAPVRRSPRKLARRNSPTKENLHDARDSSAAGASASKVSTPHAAAEEVEEVAVSPELCGGVTSLRQAPSPRPTGGLVPESRDGKRANHGACEHRTATPLAELSPRRAPVPPHTSAGETDGAIEGWPPTATTPCKAQALLQEDAAEDSPSKHTRRAEAVRRQGAGWPALQGVAAPGPLPRPPCGGLVSSGHPLSPSPAATQLHASLTRGSDEATLAVSRSDSDVRSLFGSRGGCRCYGRREVCATCAARPQQRAPRAGTPGFRPPEVLLRHPVQHAGVDVWACGVVGLCLSSGRHPFFKAPDDLTALAELCALLSCRALRAASAALGKLLLCSDDCPALDLRRVCESLRAPAPPAGEPAPQRSLTLCCSSHETSLDVCEVVRTTGPCARCRQVRVCLCAQRDGAPDARRTTGRRSRSTKPADDGHPRPRPEGGLRPAFHGTPSSNGGQSYGVAGLSPTGEYLTRLCGLRGSATRPSPRMGSPPSVASGQCCPPTEPGRGASRQRYGNSGVPPPTTPQLSNTEVGRARSPPRGSADGRGAGGRRRRPPLHGWPYPSELYDLLSRLLDPNPGTRPSAAAALQHPFLQGARLCS